MTEIDTFYVDSEPTEVMRYDLQGRRLDAPQRGLNIIKMSNGTTKKVVVNNFKA